jgi:predicted Abi (CAAX) family protease
LLRRWPDARGWALSLLLLALAAAPLYLIGHAGGFATWSPRPLGSGDLAVAALLFFIPSLGEELLFRGVLLPGRRAALFAPLSVLLFTLWHPLQAWSFGPPWAALFLEPAFLAAVFVLGVTLTAIRLVTRSLWPAIIGHWLVVAAWKLVLGGPF